MKLNLRYFVTAVAMLACAFCGTSCSDDEDGGDPDQKPTVTLADANAATESTVSFIITPTNAEICAYICQEASEAAPTAETIINSGRAVSTESASTVKVRNLEPLTDYTIYAAASSGQTYSTVAKLDLSTEEHLLSPSVAVVKGAITDSSAVFTVTPTDADKCAYQLVKATETKPDAAAVLANGTSISATEATKVELEDLDEATDYIFLVAVSYSTNVGTISETEFTTLEKEKVPTVAVVAYLEEDEEEGYTKWGNVFADIKLTDAVSAKVFCYATETLDALIAQGSYESYEDICVSVGQDLTDTFLEKALSETGLGLVWANRSEGTSYTVIVVAYGSKGTAVEGDAAVTTETEPLPDPVQSELFTKLEGTWTMTATTSDGEVSTYENLTLAGSNSGVSYRERNQMVLSGSIYWQNFYSIAALVAAGWPEADAKKDWGPKFIFQIATGDQVSVPADRTNYVLNWNSSSLGYVYLLGYNGSSLSVKDGSAFPVTVSADYNTITIKPYTLENVTYYPGIFRYLSSSWYATEMYTSDIVLTRSTSTSSAAPAKTFDLPKIENNLRLGGANAVCIDDYVRANTVAPFIVK